MKKGDTSLGDGRPSLSVFAVVLRAKDPLEDRVHMFGVVAKVEFLLDLGGAERGCHLVVFKEFFFEISALFPDLPFGNS